MSYSIKEILEKKFLNFKFLVSDEKKVALAVEKCLGKNFSGRVNFSGQKLILQTSPALKTVILLNQDKILDFLNKEYNLKVLEIG